ncbi:MAG TPA: type I-B CRISPR-associated protein Cas7/Csh2 [Bacteroidales bacterium]|jgi:CRISPR-associated protein Csh2|nr:type I-B CRISPR-associated protein Cas7/Csh2 [Methanofastidiosum sp.]HRT81441.1 type I-B CRISPR-associated protein Cas7/Csh2 [Bacteroidales bacterium]
MCITKNSEILFIYDAKMCNPNGDMDNENKPRMDYDTETNLVSDVRLKRYLRDYFEKGLEKPEAIFVTEKASTAEDRVVQILGRTPTKEKPVTKEELEKITKECIDVKLFGAVLGTTGGNDHLTGPVQFNWGYSLNPVEINESSTITSSFSSGEGVGKDFRVKYSLIAFSGGINANVAKDTKLSNDDINMFDQAMIKAIPFSRTRSKTGQTPRLYLRIEASDNKSILKDLREYLSLEYKVAEHEVREIGQLTLNFEKLTEYLADKPISEIIYWKDDSIDIKGWDSLQNKFKDKIKPLNVNKTK